MTQRDEVLKRTIERCRERNIIIPTYAEMADQAMIPQDIQEELQSVGLWDLHPRNLFRITWKNEPVERGGGFGAYRIEGIGDKHVPWIHNMRNMDLVAAIDDEHCLRLVRLFNEQAGRVFLRSRGLGASLVDSLSLLGISGIANLLGAIKTAHYFEMTNRDLIFTIATDSMELYGSRLAELRRERGEYGEKQAAVDYDSCLLRQTTDHMLELSYWDKKRMHNLKYFTWVEQLGKDPDELDRQWSDEDYWREKYAVHEEWDKKIREFNARTGTVVGGEGGIRTHDTG
ncbi:MAG: hypothetical protein KJ874_04715 [Acidobacteria bacterium]|nr:hypothetical protein [Acidobacteriota bacterium]